MTTETKVMMKCGHAANSVSTDERTGERRPCCVICIGLNPGAEQIDLSPATLEGRQARCYCGALQPSSPELAFFEYRGPGSRFALESCTCGYHRCVHDPSERVMAQIDGNGRTRYENLMWRSGGEHAFEARGPHEFDSFYDGCGGWD
jgi:hypothetical protein